MAESLANDNTTCVVCFKNVVYYSIGECDHPVCFECSTRMRVLCLQNECPICRQALSRVVFTDTVHPYKELRMRVLPDRLFERQFKIGFSSEEIKQAYEHLLVNRCKLCENIPPFRTFSQLSDHMRKTHERYYCDLCVKHLKIFTSERRCYTRQELAHHRRKGDLDDTSHRGHPLCEFCEERFMDADELYRHLRKEHLYCHLCDADGRNLYYASHSALAHHFRTDHFLCEEGDCAGNHLTAVFRTEIDLKAHKATVHGRGMTRGAARQARTLELQFNITPHSAQLVHAQRTPRDHRQQEAREPSPPPPPVPSPRIDTRSDEQFPRLSAAQPTTGLMLGGPNKAYKGMDGLTRNERNFPTLGGGAGGGGAVPPAGPSRPAPSVAAAILRNSKPAVSIQVHSQPASASNFRLTQTSGNRISIPQQQQQTSGKQPRRQPLCDDDFPSLGGKDVPKDDYPSLGAATMQPPKGFWPKKEPNGIVALANLRPQNFLQGMWEEMPLPRKGASETLRKSSGKGEKANDDDSDEMQALKSGPPSAQKKPTLSSESFPALSAAAAPAGPPPRWITVSKDKPKKAPKQPEPAPPPREPAFNQVADFPTLPVNTKAKKKSPQTQVQTNKTQAQAQINKQFQVQAHPPPSINHQSEPKQPSKKEKKKQNNNNQNNEKKDDSDPPTPTYVNGFTDKLTKQQIKEAYTAALSLNDNPTDVDKKIKTIEDSSSTEKRRNGGNGDFAFAPQDYPPLSGKSGSNSTPAPVQPSKRVNGSVAAPPGFSVAARAQCGGMTFTNSAGQTFPAPLHSYIPPPDFERRNRALVKRFTEALGSAAAVENFKVASRAYRDNILCAEEFYEHCRRAMGSQLDAVFPDLVALLPDIAKQQELVVGRDIASKLEVCSICGQLISPDDRIAHDTAHWPPLTH